jgi:hypothetical protein
MKKIIGILVMMLLISTAMTTIAVNENNYNFYEPRNLTPIDVPDEWLEGADQYQIDAYGYGIFLTPSSHAAQEFKPTKEDLTAVALLLFKKESPTNIDITVAIRNSLNGTDLTSITINADDKNIKGGGTWIMFDFDDIKVIPDETYYIVCYSSGGDLIEGYLWAFGVNNKYDKGLAWGSDNSGETWEDLEDPGWGPEFVEIDFCFITYFQEPPENISMNEFKIMLIRFIHRFPILELIF